MEISIQKPELARRLFLMYMYTFLALDDTIFLVAK